MNPGLTQVNLMPMALMRVLSKLNWVLLKKERRSDMLKLHSFVAWICVVFGCLFICRKIARVASVDTAVAILIDDTVAYCLKNFTVLLLLHTHI